MEKTQGTIIIAIYYILGLIGYFSDKVPIIALLLLVLTLFLLHKKLISNKFSIFLYLIFMFAIANCNFQVKESDALSTIAPQQATITARITSIPTTNFKDKTKFYADVKKVQYSSITKNNINAKTLVTLFKDGNDFNSLEIGDILDLTGKLNIPRESKNPSQFDYRNYLRNFDTFTVFYADSRSQKLLSKADTPYWKFLQNINKTRSKIIQKHAQNIKSPNIELLGGIVFGDDAINPPDYIKKSFINSGLLHILAASGMNVTLIFGLWFFISQKFRFHYKLSILTGILLILFYTSMTGFGPSILRASLMLIFILLGKLIDRDADSLALLFFVATILLIYDPAMINQVSFQLSFIVTFGLLLTCPMIFDKIENKIFNFVLSACLVPLIAQVYVAPIQMFYFNTFSTYSLLANIAIIPFLTIVSFIGFVSSILALIPAIALYICKFAAFVLNPLLNIMLYISNFFANLPNSLLTTTHPSLVQLILFYSAIISLTLLIKPEVKPKKLVIITSLIWVCFIASLIPIKNTDCEIIVFDVGNADSTLIKTPKNEYIMIDTGKKPYFNGASSANQILLKYMRDHGIRKLEALILTHFDSDHSGGAIDILTNIPVETIYINAHKSDSETFKDIINYLKLNNLKYKTPKHNEVIVKEGDFSLVNITPKEIAAYDENEKSLITLIKYKNHKILLPGDAGITVLNKLQRTEIKDIDVIKAGHHGSENSLDKKLLKLMSPKAVVISTGKNSYGHPNKQILKLLKDNNIKTLRTDYNNSIKVSMNNKNLKIQSYNTQKRNFNKILSY